MRSFTPEGLPGRCPRCWLKQPYCLCAEVTPLPTRTRVLVVRHQREGWKSTGTARIAALALPALTVVSYGEDAEPAREVTSALEPGAALLFPGDSSAGWPSPPPGVLVVLDGTWRQTRRMYQRLPGLHGLPQVRLSAPALAGPRLRAQTQEDGRSTLEAIADALGALEGPQVAQALHGLHRQYVERVLRARGMWGQRQGEG